MIFVGRHVIADGDRGKALDVERIGIAPAVDKRSARLCIITECDAVRIADAIAGTGRKTRGTFHLITAAEYDAGRAFRRVGITERQTVESARGRVAAAGPREKADIRIVPLVLCITRTKRTLIAVPRSAVPGSLIWRNADPEIARRDETAVLKDLEPRRSVSARTAAASRSAAKIDHRRRSVSVAYRKLLRTRHELDRVRVDVCLIRRVAGIDGICEIGQVRVVQRNAGVERIRTGPAVVCIELHTRASGCGCAHRCSVAELYA